MQLVEALFRPYRTARLVDKLINAAGDAVVNQIQHFAVRVEIEPELGFVRQFLVQILNRRRNVKQQQATQTAPHGLLLFLWIIKQLDGHAVALVHQRRPGFHLIVAALLFIAFRQGAKAPDMQPALLDAIISDRRQRLLNFALQRLFQRLQRAPFLQLLVFIIHHPESDFQVIGHLIPLPGFAVDGHAGHLTQLALQGIEQRQLKRRRPAKKRFRIVGSRDKIAPHRLRQRFYQRDNQLATQARDLPFKPGLLHLVQQRQRNMHRHAVGVGARLKLIAKPKLKVALMPEVRIVQLANLLRPFLNQHALLKVEQIRRLFAGLLPPAVEVAGGDDVVADALVVEFEQGLVVHQNVAAARLMLQLFDFRPQLQVLPEEGVARLPVALHQRVADKQLAAQRRIDLAVVDLTRAHDRQAVDGDLFRRHHRALRPLPVRLAV